MSGERVESVAGVGHICIGQRGMGLYRVGSELHAPADPRAGRLHRVGEVLHAPVVNGGRRPYRVGSGVRAAVAVRPVPRRAVRSVAELLIVREVACCWLPSLTF
jgi:hypothetical protein